MTNKTQTLTIFVSKAFKNGSFFKIKSCIKFTMLFYTTKFIICLFLFGANVINSKAVFYTTNKGKYSTAKDILGIDLDHDKTEITEIQGTADEIILDKLTKVIKNIKPGNLIIVEDTCVFFKGLPNFPGAYAKEFILNGIESMLKTFKILGENRCIQKTIFGLAYRPNNQTIHMKFFMGEVVGQLELDYNVTDSTTFNDIFTSNEKNKAEYKNVIPIHIGRIKALKEMVKYIKKNYNKKINKISFNYII